MIIAIAGRPRTQGARKRLAKKWYNKELWPTTPGADVGIFKKRPKNQPQPYWESLQRTRWTYGLFLFAATAAYLLLIFDIIPGLPKYAMLGFPLVWLTAGVSRFFAHRIAFRRFVKKLRSADMHVCIICGYSLRGLPPQHSCPECGTAYDVTELCPAWECWIEKRKLPAAFVRSQSTNDEK